MTNLTTWGRFPFHLWIIPVYRLMGLQLPVVLAVGRGRSNSDSYNTRELFLRPANLFFKKLTNFCRFFI